MLVMIKWEKFIIKLIQELDKTFDLNKKIARLGGHAAKVAKDDIEKRLGKSVISSKNLLNYKYIDNDKQRIK